MKDIEINMLQPLRRNIKYAKARIAAAGYRHLRIGNHLLRLAQITLGISKPTLAERIYTSLALPCAFPFKSPHHCSPGTLNPIQYWSQGAPPADVAELTNRWNYELSEAGLPQIKIYSRSTAFDYIRNYMPCLELPFSTAFHYALEADIFRIAVAAAEGCMWLDCDLLPRRRCGDLLREIAECRESTYFVWRPNRRSKPRITNSFFNVVPGCNVMNQICRTTSNIDFRLLPATKDTIAWNGGPKLYNAVIELFLTGGYHVRRNRTLASVSSDKGKLNFIDKYSFLDQTKAPGLSYTGTSMQWQIAVPDT